MLKEEQHQAVLGLRGKKDVYRRTGRGGEGAAAPPPQILGNSDFLGSKRKFGQSHFLKTFLCFFNNPVTFSRDTHSG